MASPQVDLPTLPVTRGLLGAPYASTVGTKNVEIQSALEPGWPKREGNWKAKTEEEGDTDKCAFEETINSLRATQADLFSLLLTEDPSQ